MTDRTPVDLVKAPGPEAPAADAPTASRPPLDDPLFGPVTVAIAPHAHITVSGPAIPRTDLVRSGGLDGADPHSAIGTRSAAALTLTVANAPAAVRPGKGRFRRSTYKVDATHDGIHYRLVPTSIGTSTFLRDGKPLGEFTADGDETVLVEWREDADPQPVDASVGYTLAAAYGTGGQPMWMTLIDVVTDFIP
ncbi:hypothetical protein OG897_02170 [Streptomyces sp. NBC_00237]|uniref:hypothetical protein n=1 Tax=Streptomyces sp. NBC_00237 TaxID=2975687 RepID=UPI0022507B6D|nr:hypothetical protein [Streptomyces sp. NBC_00237]MCX5200271.1 hypothetical protein [Streptomyces sp. NBC_00237]